jgi:hypothetical protein
VKGRLWRTVCEGQVVEDILRRAGCGGRFEGEDSFKGRLGL